MDDEMRTRFDQAVTALLKQKREDNKAFLSAEEYERRVLEVKRSRLVLRTAGEKKTARDYRVTRKYDVTVDADGRERLVRPVTGTRYVTNGELFDVLHAAHLDVGHGGRNRMVAVLKTRYSNVTKEAVMTYLKLCARCNPAGAAAAAPSAGKPDATAAVACTTATVAVTSETAPDAAAAAAVKTETAPDAAAVKTETAPKSETAPAAVFGGHHGVFGRARIELIDMQERVYDEYRFVVRHSDHATKFVHLIALRSMRPEEVAHGLLDVYAAFGVPAVIESLCGSEYVGSVIEYIRSVWDWATIEYAEPGPRARDNSGEREHVVEMLDAWEEAKNCDNWPMALRLIQLQRNCEVHPAIGMTPYQAMFGRPPSLCPFSSDYTYSDSNAAGVDGDDDEHKATTSH